MNEKQLATLLTKYNVTNVAKLPEVQEQRRKTFASKRIDLVYNPAPILNRIPAERFKVFILNKGVADMWLNKYHPLGAPRGNVLSLGLVEENTIYCIMTFKKSRNTTYDAELSRMWTLPTYQIIGGYDMLSQFASEYGLSSIVAYVSISFEDVSNYESIGMRVVGTIQKTKWWTNSKTTLSDASRRQKKIPEQALLDSGWIALYDKGKVVLEYVSPT